MSFSNPWFLLATFGILAVYHLELITTFLNLKRLGLPIPRGLEDVYPTENQERLNEYISESAHLRIVERSVFLTVLIFFWWSGGFGGIQRLSEAWSSQNPVLAGIIAIVLIASGQMLISLPFEIWSTFGIETKYGFNRTTPATFIADRIKGLGISALLGIPLVATIVWLFHTQPLAALYGWALVAFFSVFMTWISPRVFIPLYLKFQPLPEGELRTAIFALSEKLEFPVAEVSIVDGSRRSTKANAFFAGFGKTRRIALYDTLLAKHSTAEILAILAHEIGHNKCRHVPVTMAVALLELGFLFALLHFALRSPSLYAAFSVSDVQIGLGLILFSLVYQPLSLLSGIIGLALSRKHEFEADAFAAKALGTGTPLATSLKKFSGDHLAHPQPHPLMIQLHYSHPPLAQRLAALSK